MRRGFVLSLLVVIAAIIGVGWMLQRLTMNQPVTASQRENAVADEPPKSVTQTSTSVPTPRREPFANITPEKRQAAIDTEIERLREWSSQDDAHSFSSILADLSHPEKEVREVAVESLKEFGDTNAIPALKAAAQNSEDTREKIAMLEAAEFLSLPQLNVSGNALEESAATANASNPDSEQQTSLRRHALRPAKPKTISGVRGGVGGGWSGTNTNSATP